MPMRVAVGIYDSDIDRAIDSYRLMSQRYFTHASPHALQRQYPKSAVERLLFGHNEGGVD